MPCSIANLTGRVLFGFFGLIVASVVAAVASALAPLPGRIQSIAAEDPPVFVCASLAHTDIVLPIVDAAADWVTVFPDVTSKVPRSAYLAIGWGDLGVYENTPRWRDLRLSVAFEALAGLDPTTIHVVAVRAPSDESGCLMIAVDQTGRRALARFVEATAEDDALGQPRLIDSPRRRGFLCRQRALPSVADL